MEMFYFIVASVAIVILILFLTFMGILLRYQNSSVIYPPQMSNCPDYWTSDMDGNCFKPTVKSFSNPDAILNIGSLDNLSSTSAPFSTDGISFDTKNPLWSTQGKSAICAQKIWSNTNGIVWDSVSNYNQC